MINRLILRRVCLMLILSFIILYSIFILAGDEDMSPSLYQRFDPETGFTVPVDPRKVTNHQIGNSNANSGTRENSIASDSENEMIEKSTSDVRLSQFLVVGIVVLVASGIFFALMRKR